MSLVLLVQFQIQTLRALIEWLRQLSFDSDVAVSKPARDKAPDALIEHRNRILLKVLA